ncbi:MAG: response regulator transcription factor [Saprospiraceae bacterium]
MNNIFVLYIGDDPVIAEYLRTYSDELGWKISVISAGEEVMDPLIPEPDVCLLDLNYSSQENYLINNLLERKEIKKILLADSADEDLYIRYRKYLPFGYLVRPLTEIHLRAQIESTIISFDVHQKAIQILRSWKEEEELHNSFFIKNNNKLLKVKQSDILVVIADGNYCVIITPQRRHAIKISLRRIKMKLSVLLFKQIHRNYIIQLGKVDSVDLSTNEVSIDGDLYPIGGSFRQRFLDHLDRI